jgi:uncharacterized membrane protein YfcA
MMGLGEWDLLLLAGFALLAGFIDAVAGGGGLIQVPGLFAVLPQESPARIFGTNKLASVFGTANATWRYARRLALPWEVALPAAAMALLFSFGGAAVVDWLPKEVVRPVVLGLLVMVILHTLWNRDFGKVQGVRPEGKVGKRRALIVGAVMGFYDGFFGPGAGSFLIFAFVRFFGMDFLHASSTAKVVNLATNVAALAYFAPTGNVIWLVGGVMAGANLVGAQIGARTALRHGSGFVRWVFVVVASVLAVRFGIDTFR